MPLLPRLPTRTSPPHTVAVATLVLGCATGLVLLGIAVAGDKILQADLDVALWVQRIDLPAWDQLLDLGELITGFPVGFLIWAGLVAGFAALRRHPEALLMLVTQGIWLPKTVVKAAVASPRPPEDLLAVTDFGGGFGFPSGHMSGGFAVYGMLAIIAFISLGPGRRRFIPPAIIAPLLIIAAFDRVASGAHWPSDVLGSLLLAGVWLTTLTLLYLRLRHRGIPLPARRRAIPPAATPPPTKSASPDRPR